MDSRLMIFLFVLSGALLAAAVYACYCRVKKEGFADGGGVTVTFWKMDTCPYCIEFDDTFKKLKEKWEKSGGDVKVTFVVNNDTDAAKRLQIYSFPTVQFTLPDGSVVNFEGERSVENLSNKIKELSAKL
jgi:thiol-disulfide isomerase/thioredoxin